MDEQRRYGTRVGDALKFAAEKHATQTRKGKDEPYLSHLLMVAGLVAHYNGTEDQIIAGVLHDAVEDQGGQQTADEIRELFGDRVADIVLDCSDATPTKGEQKPPWFERKQAYLERLCEPDNHGSRLVEACDKLANLRDIVEDVESSGAHAFAHFNAGQADVVWYYRRLGEVLMPQVPAVQSEYDALLQRLEAAAG